MSTREQSFDEFQGYVEPKDKSRISISTCPDISAGVSISTSISISTTTEDQG